MNFVKTIEKMAPSKVVQNIKSNKIFKDKERKFNKLSLVTIGISTLPIAFLGIMTVAIIPTVYLSAALAGIVYYAGSIIKEGIKTSIIPASVLGFRKTEKQIKENEDSNKKMESYLKILEEEEDRLELLITQVPIEKQDEIEMRLEANADNATRIRKYIETLKLQKAELEKSKNAFEKENEKVKVKKLSY